MCALLRENSSMQSYQILHEDCKTPECVHLRFGFPNFLLIFILLIKNDTLFYKSETKFYVSFCLYTCSHLNEEGLHF